MTKNKQSTTGTEQGTAKKAKLEHKALGLKTYKGIRESDTKYVNPMEFIPIHTKRVANANDAILKNTGLTTTAIQSITSRIRQLVHSLKRPLDGLVGPTPTSDANAMTEVNTCVTAIELLKTALDNMKSKLNQAIPLEKAAIPKDHVHPHPSARNVTSSRAAMIGNKKILHVHNHGAVYPEGAGGVFVSDHPGLVFSYHTTTTSSENLHNKDEMRNQRQNSRSPQIMVMPLDGTQKQVLDVSNKSREEQVAYSEVIMTHQKTLEKIPDVGIHSLLTTLCKTNIDIMVFGESTKYAATMSKMMNDFKFATLSSTNDAPIGHIDNTHGYHVYVRRERTTIADRYRWEHASDGDLSKKDMILHDKMTGINIRVVHIKNSKVGSCEKNKNVMMKLIADANANILVGDTNFAASKPDTNNVKEIKNDITYTGLSKYRKYHNPDSKDRHDRLYIFGEPYLKNKYFKYFLDEGEGEHWRLKGIRN